MMLLGVVLLISSVLLGGAIVVFLQHLNQGKIIKILLSLSGGFLLALSFVHFMPEIYAHSKAEVGYYILLGFLIQLFLEYFSGGIEHGHIHPNGKGGVIPWTLFLALSFHSFFETIPLATQFSGEASEHLTGFIAHHHHNLSEQKNGFLIGIILHNIPVAIALMTLLLSSGVSKNKAWLVLFILSLMSPLGMFVGYYGSHHIEWFNSEIILAVVVGMFLHISTTIIFESTDNHQFNLIKLISLLSGVGLAIAVI